MVTQQTKDLVTTKVRDCLSLAEAHYGRNFQFPVITYDIRGTTAGKANYVRWQIQFNSVLLNENLDAFLARTVPHEVAHLIDFAVNAKNFESRIVTIRNGRRRRSKRDVHGDSWKAVMRLFGADDATRCHEYDVTNSRMKKTRTRYQYKCSCGFGKIITVGPKIHSRITYVSRYRYRACKHSIIKDHHIGANVIRPDNTQVILPPKQTRGGTRIDQAIHVIQKCSSMDPKDMVRAIIQELGVSEVTAKTYYYAASARIKRMYVQNFDSQITQRLTFNL